MSEFTTVDRVLAKFHRDLKGTDFNESDLIEWIGEALDFLKVPQVQEEAVAFIEVKDYHADLPKCFHMILQIARNNKWSQEKKEVVCSVLSDDDNKEEDCCKECHTHPANKAGYPIPLDRDGKPITDYEVAYYRPFFDLQWEYNLWTNSNSYKQDYTPVRLSNNSFFNSIVCKEKNNIYNNCEDEYTIVGSIDKKLRFSFKNGSVAVSYLKNRIDPETGYFLIPDNISYTSAIVYYVKWKIAEWYDWSGRQGFTSIAQNSERLWLKYARQAKNFMKMPKSLDEYQNLLEQTHYLIPNHKRYYGYFGNNNDLRFNNVIR